jgi:hypothetical protein
VASPHYAPRSRHLLYATVRCAVRKASSVAPLSHLAAEAFRGEWLAELRDKESEITTRAGINDLLQNWENRKLKPHRMTIAIFLLRELEHAAADVLATKQHHI